MRPQAGNPAGTGALGATESRGIRARGVVSTVPRQNGAGVLEHGPCRHPLASLLTAGMVLDDVVQVDCAAGCGHRLYSDRGRLECPCHWPAAKVAQIARAMVPKPKLIYEKGNMKVRIRRFMRPYGRKRKVNPLKWQWRDRILIVGELVAFLSAVAAIPIELLGWGFASWCLIAAAIIGTSALLWYAFDLISVGEAPANQRVRTRHHSSVQSQQK